jgi:hypothetical protein
MNLDAANQRVSRRLESFREGIGDTVKAEGGIASFGPDDFLGGVRAALLSGSDVTPDELATLLDKLVPEYQPTLQVTAQLVQVGAVDPVTWALGAVKQALEHGIGIGLEAAKGSDPSDDPHEHPVDYGLGDPNEGR